MNMIWSILRFFLFRLDPEDAHQFTFAILRVLRPVARLLIRVGVYTKQTHTVAGLQFLNPIGLAAGLDKNAECLEWWPVLGFGFAEVGTVTPRAQPGNPKPRLFRIVAEESLVNRMGFNNLGASLMAEKIRECKPYLPKDFRIGVNLGKNKETPLEDASKDYALAASYMEGLADYLVINVSSPNTPNLRKLQEINSLSKIITAVRQATSSWKKQPLLLVKFAPEFDQSEIAGELCRICDGVVYSNTWATQKGGQSGPMLQRSAAALWEQFGEAHIKVSVGGIDSKEELTRRIEGGADLAQVYTALIFQGPALIRKLNKVKFIAKKQLF